MKNFKELLIQEKSIIEKLELNIKVSEDKENEFQFTVSTEKEDRHGDVVIQKGLDLKWYKKNPIVLLDHNYSVEKIIGKTIKIWQDTEGTHIKGVFADTPEADTVKKLYKDGFPLMTSIGFITVQRDEKDFSKILKSELLEISIVAVGSNRLALKKSLGENFETLCKDAGIKIDEEKPEEVQEEKKEDLKEEVKNLKKEVAELKEEMARFKIINSEEKKIEEIKNADDSELETMLRNFNKESSLALHEIKSRRK